MSGQRSEQIQASFQSSWLTTVYGAVILLLLLGRPSLVLGFIPSSTPYIMMSQRLTTFHSRLTRRHGRNGTRILSLLSNRDARRCRLFHVELEAHETDHNEDNSLLSALEDKIQRLVPRDQPTLNLHSPQQVSKALFNGQVHSTSKTALQSIVDGHNVTDTQRELAALVLEYRRQWRKQHATNDGGGKMGTARLSSSSSSSQRAFSSLPELDRDDDDDDDDDDELEDISEVISDVTIVERSGNEISLNEETIEILEVDLTEDSFSTPSLSVDPFERQIHALFKDEKKSKLNLCWKESLLQLTRPSARSLIPQLTPDCPMGFDPTAIPLDPLLSKFADSSTTTTTAGKKGSFLAYVREQKEKYPDCIILCRCGDFYETFGVDALMLIEHCGLNPMGAKAKAGCPIRNVQATLDALTAQGFRVAVYEEAADTDATSGAGSSGGSKSRLKSRFLAQIVSPASPTYLYDLLLSGNTADTISNAPAARPFCGVLSLAAGYTLVEVSWEERTARVSERLTAEAVACRLAAYPPADPLFYLPSPNEPDSSNLPFLPSRRELASAGYGAKLRTHILSPYLVKAAGPSEVERAKHIIVQAVLSLAGDGIDDDIKHRTTVDDFTLVSTPETTVTNPLSVETATQLGKNSVCFADLNAWNNSNN